MRRFSYTSFTHNGCTYHLLGKTFIKCSVISFCVFFLLDFCLYFPGKKRNGYWWAGSSRILECIMRFTHRMTLNVRFMSKKMINHWFWNWFLLLQFVEEKMLVYPNDCVLSASQYEAIIAVLDFLFFLKYWFCGIHTRNVVLDSAPSGLESSLHPMPCNIGET